MLPFAQLDREGYDYVISAGLACDSNSSEGDISKLGFSQECHESKALVIS
jgi:hypothetical protein